MVPSMSGPGSLRMIATTSSPLRVLCVSSACARQSTSLRCSSSSCSVRSSSRTRLNSMRSPSTSGARSGWRLAGSLSVMPMPPPGPRLRMALPPMISSSWSAGSEVTPEPMPQYDSIIAVR